MRRSIPLVIAFFLGALPLFAGEPHQSYISYETGDALVVQQQDGRSIDARLNLPLYPGDIIRTQRHGQLEIRLSDGNVFGVDRATELQFSSILESYDGDSEGTVAQLRTGKVLIQRLGTDSAALRLDTAVASYVATADAIYGVATGGRGQDTISVYDGTVEVRTATRTGRLRSGDSATVDSGGIGAVLTVSRYGMSDFEDWILHRWERTSSNSRYLDSRLSYASSDLDYYGGWVYVNSYNTWAWRPRVSVGWQPYHYGSWSYGPSGSLVWVSDEPWGWVPYHYGRWAYSGGYGWVWVPGAVYSPAWVYWAFGPSYIGWVPAGWYDCWGPYYSWAYYPYSHGYHGYGGSHGRGGNGGHDGHGAPGNGGRGGSHGNIGLGFYGRVNMGDVDLNHWTFVDPNTVVSHRTDRASLTTDEIRNRLKRGGDNVTVAGGGVSLSRDEWKDPVSAVRTISRRGIGSGTGKEGSGAAADLTPFFRRDPELPSTVRNQVARISNGAVVPPTTSTVTRGTSGGGAAGTPTDLGGAVRRSDSPGLGGLSRIPRTTTPDTSGRIVRPTVETGGTATTPRSTSGSPRIAPRTSSGGGTVQRPATSDRGATSDNWRSGAGNRSTAPAVPRIVPRDSSSSDRQRSTTRDQQTTTRTVVPRSRTIDRGDAPATSNVQSVPNSDAWRSRGSGATDRVNRTTTPRSTGGDRSIDIPRRIIDQIGGARVVPSGGSPDRGSMNRDRGSSSTPRPASVDRPPSSSSPSPSHSSPPPSSPAPSSSSHSNSSSGRAKIK